MGVSNRDCFWVNHSEDSKGSASTMNIQMKLSEIRDGYGITSDYVFILTTEASGVAVDVSREELLNVLVQENITDKKLLIGRTVEVVFDGPLFKSWELQ